MATRDYTGEGITVHWDSDRCYHSERCTMGLPTVFDRASRPWVDVAGAPADRIAAVVDTCPSGALSYTRTDGGPIGRRGRTPGEDPAASLAPEADWVPHTVAAEAVLGATVVVTPLENGPLSVDGTVAITRPDGALDVVEHCELCRCGHSANKPFCDGSHARVGFTAPGAIPPGLAR